MENYILKDNETPRQQLMGRFDAAFYLSLKGAIGGILGL